MQDFVAKVPPIALQSRKPLFYSSFSICESQQDLFCFLDMIDEDRRRELELQQPQLPQQPLQFTHFE
jgi:hypothetical protein